MTANGRSYLHLCLKGQDKWVGSSVRGRQQWLWR